MVSFDSQKKGPAVFTRESSRSSSASSIKPPRTPRFAEATTVYSPIEPTETGRSPFDDPIEPPKTPRTQFHMPQAQPSDIGFGYISQNDPSRNSQGVPVEVPLTPASPLKSAMKVPGTPGRRIDNPLSPTFREEQLLEKHEKSTDKEQAKDLKVKTRVRMAKFLLRGVNFSCSLIVLSMVSATFSIFNATRTLPPRNNLPPWAQNTKTWPQITILVVSCISLALCLLVFFNYWKGGFRRGHQRAEKVAVYYTLFAVGFFIFNTVMWGIAAGILQGSKNNSNNKDIWGWACLDNTRSQLFSQEIDYALVCRMQSWSLICALIEIILEVITILLYSIVFYRYYSKQRLRKSMELRDKARSDLYLAQLRTQSAPNTPGFGPLSPSYSQYVKSPRFPPTAYTAGPTAEDGLVTPGTRFVETRPDNTPLKPFALQPPPIKVHAASPQSPQGGFESGPLATEPKKQTIAERRNKHVEAAPGEQTYAAVPIPGAYAPTPTTHSFGNVGQAVTSEQRVHSPPGSPRAFR
ncbi:hypothetical protein F5884DRAFT_174753 [Xylogone sp. PMI_703]|nr:hypothetical protein F5884DRAFT_174753 [Xylogone sp. PMI_703]